MYEAKRSQQSGIAVFDASMREAAVDRLALEENDRRISPVVKAIVDVAHSLDLVVASEGIESESDRMRMLTLGVKRTQGPLHGGAVPAPAIPSTVSYAARDHY